MAVESCGISSFGYHVDAHDMEVSIEDNEPMTVPKLSGVPTTLLDRRWAAMEATFIRWVSRY